MSPRTLLKAFKQPGAVVAIGTIISRLTGFVREVLLAHILGSSLAADIMNIALRLPNLFRKLFGEGAITQAFIPIYCKLKPEDKNPEGTSNKYESSRLYKQNNSTQADFLGQIFIWLIMGSIILSLLVAYIMPEVIWIIAPGLSSDLAGVDTAVMVSRITVFYIGFICPAALLGAALNSHNIFFPFAIVPIIPNIVMSCILILIMYFGSLNTEVILYSSGLGLVVSGVLQLLFMMVFAKKNNIAFTFQSKITQHTKTFLKNLAILSLGNGASQINILVSQAIASIIPGCIAILSYADRIYQLPVSILGITLSTIMLPRLSQTNSDNNPSIVSKSLVTTMLIVLPTMAGIISLATPGIQFIYQHGAFNESDTAKTAEVLSLLALSLPGFISIRILSAACYAKTKHTIPTLIGILAVISNLIISYSLIVSYEHLASPIANLFATYLSAIGLMIYAYRKQYFKLKKPHFIDLFKGALSAIAMYYLIEFTPIRLMIDESMLNGSSRLMLFFGIVLISIIGAGFYLGCLALLGIDIRKTLGLKTSSSNQ